MAIEAQQFTGDKQVLYALMAKWNEAKTVLEVAKATEMDLRKQVAALAFPIEKGGTQRIELEGGHTLKNVQSEKFEFDKDISKVQAAYQAICKISNVGPILAQRLFKWSADLVVKEYKALNPQTSNDEKEIKAILDSVLTSKFSSPTLEIEEPKKVLKPGPILAHSLK